MDDIAITGIGIISSMGIGKDAFWSGCRNARTGIKRITSFETDSFSSNVAGWIDDFDPGQFMPRRSYRRMSRVSRMAVAASVEALEDSGITIADGNKDSIAVIMGTAYGSSAHVEDFFVSLLRDGPRGAQPFLFPETVPNAPASQIAIFHGITGPNSTFCQNEISAESALLYGRTLLLQGIADTVIVGGADELSEMQYSCYNALDILNRTKAAEGESISPEMGGGLILGEGAGILIMERLNSAIERGATIYGLLRAATITGGITSPSHYETGGKEMKRAITLAIKEAGMSSEEIDQISVSANFSGNLDETEYRILGAIFAEGRENLKVSPLKYLMGTFGGAGTTRAAAALLSLHHHLPLPTVAAETLKTRGRQPFEWNIPPAGVEEAALMTSSTFGGGSSGLIFTRL